jgi:hypothetical protein
VYKKKPDHSNLADAFFMRYTNSNITTDTYELNDGNCRIDASVSNAGKSIKIFNLVSTGTLTISRWDLKNKIGSGTFSMRIKEKNTGEIISISEGRFDVVLEN